MPSLSSSPWIHGAPHPMFADCMSWMSLRISLSIGGRPTRRRRLSNANSVESLLGANARRYQGAMCATSPAIRPHTSQTEPRKNGQEPTPAGASPTTGALRAAGAVPDSRGPIVGATGIESTRLSVLPATDSACQGCFNKRQGTSRASNRLSFQKAQVRLARALPIGCGRDG